MFRPARRRPTLHRRRARLPPPLARRIPLRRRLLPGSALRRVSLFCAVALSCAAFFALFADVARARGGEDWPFFCHMSDEASSRTGDVAAFKIISDSNSPTGYGVEIIEDMNDSSSITYVYADLQDMGDQPYFRLKAVDTNYGWLKDRTILAYISKDGTYLSQGAVSVTLHNRVGKFYLQPLNCGARDQ